jgi:signal transduction histidine kinase
VSFKNCSLESFSDHFIVLILVTKRSKDSPAVSRKLFRRRAWIPTAVFVVGLLSFAILSWGYRINERQRHYFAVADVIMEVQIKAAVSQLWFEKAIAGDTTIDIDGVWRSLDQSVGLVEVLLSGGKSEYGLIVRPLRDSEMLSQAEDMKVLLLEIIEIARERYRDQSARRIDSERAERLDAVFSEFQDKAISSELMIEGKYSSDQERTRAIFLIVTLVWMMIVLGATIGLWIEGVRRANAEEALEKAKDRLEIKVAERTKDLKAAGDQLRNLASQLLTAQEKERKRISAGLHDELGGSLAFLKVEFSLIEKRLDEHQVELRERCRRNLEYLDQITDNVSRLSRNLSPYLLEELGLSAALRSLLGDFAKRSKIQVTFDIPEMNHMLAKHAEIAIYRIIQESLTNIRKHAEARHVSMVVNIDDDSIHFVIEDDGKGFDVEQALGKDAREKGMGLITMDERVRMLGGAFDLWSQKGQGSRITFRIPKRREETLS